MRAWCLHVLSIQYMRRYRLSSILDDTVSNTGVVHVSDVSRVIRRYLSGISARLDVSCLRGVSAAGTYLPYTYPTRLLPLLLHTIPTPPARGSCIVYVFRMCYPYLLPLPTTPCLIETTLVLRQRTDPRRATRLTLACTD